MGETERDEHGEYDVDAGSPHPIDPDDVQYDPCNAVLRHTWDRYGERRYCSGMAVSNFTKHGAETDYEYDGYCKHHQMRGSNMERHEDQLTTGAYTKSHEHLFQHLPPHKQLIANDLYRSLLGESTYDFDTEAHELRIDVADNDFAGPETDTVVLDHPIPTQKEVRAKALWHAALDFMKIESIGDEQFRVAAQEDHDGRELAIGERTTFVATDDDFKEVVEEHHLNLPLSRIQKDYKEHMKFGGVPYDGNEEAVGEMSTHDWVAVVEADEEEMQPESKRSESSPLTDIEVPDDD